MCSNCDDNIHNQFVTPDNNGFSSVRQKLREAIRALSFSMMYPDNAYANNSNAVSPYIFGSTTIRGHKESEVIHLELDKYILTKNKLSNLRCSLRITRCIPQHLGLEINRRP